MSVENNSARSIDGLNTIFCDVINVVESIEIDGDNGNANQLLTSDGIRTLWRDLSSLLSQLSVSSPLSFVTGSFYDGSVARAIQIADVAIANIKLENSTISGKELGTNLDSLFFGHGLYAINSGAIEDTIYNGTEFIGFSVKPKVSGGITVDTDGVSLTSDTISGISLGSNLTSLSVSSPLSFTSGSSYNGGTARTIQIGNIPNSALQYSTISGINLGSDLANLQLYYGLEFLSGSTYNGGTGRTLNLKAKSGGGISVDGTGAFLTNTTISGVSLGSDLNDLTAGNGIDYSTGTTYNGDTAKSIHLKPEYLTIGDRMFYESSAWRLAINAGDWRPNDDSSFYNIHIEDDDSDVNGRGKIATSSLEAVALVTIPSGWTPTHIYLDVKSSTGTNLSRFYYVKKVRNWGGSGGETTHTPTTNTTNAERALTGSYGTGTSEFSMFIDVSLTSTGDFLGGGYIRLTPPTSDDY